MRLALDSAARATRVRESTYPVFVETLSPKHRDLLARW